jgi:hypothetical protein
MKKIRNNSAFIIATVIMIALAAGCKKDKDEKTGVDSDVSTASDNAVSDAAFNDVANIADEAATGSLDSYRGHESERVMTSCATVTVDTVSVPHLITIDFGTTDCLCKDGNYRRGIILVTFNGHYRDSASTHSITFDNYYINFNKLDGTKTVTNLGRNNNGHLTFSISVNGSIIWDAQYGGGTSTYNSNRTREWIAGESTMIWTDDVYLISGTASGTTRSGASYSLSTVTPLRKRIGFKHFTDGIVDFTPANKPTRTIDYGYVGGAEDNLALVTINGHTFTITLH